ncbi:hypothetical protein VP01_1386g7 [Puccinia sorghi]|uniref:Uncharacterized protein n=1 Tax=Puccinia sorghi TaxID=27349 RepID=A0A0L6VLF8_9BASI|nr:hypothetical protein VP01_1386g7 [Puccinia sorghi]
MVRYSKQKLLITTLETSIMHEFVAMVLAMIVRGYIKEISNSEKETEEKEDMLDSTNVLLGNFNCNMQEIFLMQSKQYLRTPPQIEKAPLISEFLLSLHEEKQFKQKFHMARGSFLKLCEEVLMNVIFHIESPSPQQSVVQQIMVTIKH